MLESAQAPEQEEEVVLTIEELEKKARASLLAAQYDVAQKILNPFERSLTDAQSASTHFYLGEIAQLNKDPAKASGHYLRAFQKAPATDKPPKSLLKLAIALHNLDKQKEACASLDKVLTEYPKADATTLSMTNAKIKEYKCNP